MSTARCIRCGTTTRVSSKATADDWWHQHKEMCVARRSSPTARVSHVAPAVGRARIDAELEARLAVVRRYKPIPIDAVPTPNPRPAQWTDASTDRWGARRKGLARQWSNGQCLQASIASVMGAADIAKVPDPTVSYDARPGDWTDHYNARLVKATGYRLEFLDAHAIPPRNQARSGSPASPLTTATVTATPSSPEAPSSTTIPPASTWAGCHCTGSISAWSSGRRDVPSPCFAAGTHSPRHERGEGEAARVAGGVHTPPLTPSYPAWLAIPPRCLFDGDPVVKTCACGCGRRFQPKSNRQRFATPACRFATRAVIDAGRYGPAHRRLRREVAATIATGVPVSCARCGLPILPGAPFDLDHADDNSGRYLGAWHPDCNRATSRRETYEDDPANGVYWGPPTHPGDPPRRWSRHWYDWRPGQPSYDEG